MACLSAEERDLGVALVEIGAAVTNVSLFAGGMLVGLTSLPFGSSDITDDIASAFGVRRSQVCNLAKGRSVRPTPEHMEALIALHATGLPGPYNPRDMTRRKVRHEA